MQLRTLAFLPFLSFPLPAWSQDLTRKIDYTTKAVTMQRAFAEMGQQAGVKLFAQPELQHEIIVLRLQDIPLQDAMQKIADTVGAQWEKKPDGYELDRTPEIEDKLRRQALDAKAQTIEDALAKKEKELSLDKPLSDAAIAGTIAKIAAAKQQNNGQDYQAMGALQESLPDARCAFRVFARIDPRKIAALSDEGKLVFSNKPNKAQQDIPGDLSDIADLLQDEHNRFLAAYPQPADPHAQPDPYFYSLDTATKIDTRPDRFVLSVSNEMFSDSKRLQLLVFDGQGKAIISATDFLQTEEYQGIMADRAKVAKATEKEPEIELSPVTKQFLDYMRKAGSGQGGAGAEPVSGELRDALLHPEDTDPLFFAASEAFLGVADYRNENLVFYPDDSMFLVGMAAGMEGKLKPSLAMQALKTLGQAMYPIVDEKDGWLTIAPNDRIGALEGRMNRAALGAFLRDDAENGFVTIASWAKLASAIRGTELPMLAMYIPMLLSPELQFTTGDITMLKFYATLDPAQLQTLQQSGLRVGDMLPDQVALLSHFVYTNSDFQSHPMMNTGNLPEAEMLAKQEMTESLPTGLPQDVLVTASSNKTPIYFAKVATDTDTFTQAVNVSTLTYYLQLMDHPDNSHGNWHPRVQSVEPGEQTTITLAVHLPGNDQMTADLKEMHKVPGGPWNVDNLPDDLKKQIDQQRRWMPPPPDSPPQPAPPAAHVERLADQGLIGKTFKQTVLNGLTIGYTCISVRFRSLLPSP